MAAPAVVADVRAALEPHPPFSQMRAEDMAWLAHRVALAYFAPGERVAGPEDGPAPSCWIVRDGTVEARRAGTDAADDPPARLTAGDAFPVGALLAERPAGATYRAVGDVFCWVMGRDDFAELLRRSDVFLDFCKRRLGAMLDLSQQALQASFARHATQARTLSAPLSELIGRAPVSVAPGTSLREAFEAMERERVGSVIVGDAQGIFTRQDVIGRVVLPRLPLEAPIESVMTAPLITLDARASAAEAMLLMAAHRIRHVPVMRDGRLVGVVTERDLFALQRRSLRTLGESIAVAGSVDRLARVAEDIRAWSAALVAQGVAAAFATRLISRLNDQLTARLIALHADEAGVSMARACWLAMGSEGREEQTIATDQDNGLILPDGIDPADRARMLSFADAVNHALDACGYPLCQGGVMAGNPRWCLEARAWRALFDGWIDRGDPESLLGASIFFDFRPIAGDASLAAALRAQVTVRAAANPRFLKQMTDNALRSGPPASWTGGPIGQLLATESAEVDLKRSGTAVFVDGARLLALAHGVAQTGTADRLATLARAGTLRPEEVRGWVDAFQFLQGLRLRVQHEGAAAGTAAANLLDTRGLSALDRRILRESFRQARTLQRRLAIDFPG